MSEPKRLLTDETTSALARSLLTAGRARRASEDARERVWSAVGAGIAGGTATGVGVSTSLVTVGKLKLAALTFVVATAVTGAGVAVVRATQPSSPTVHVPTLAAVPPVETDRHTKVDAPSTAVAPVTSTPAPPEMPPPSRENVSVRRVSERKVPPAPSVERSAAGNQTLVAGQGVAFDKLREEAALLRAAHTALGRGDTTTARAKLEEARTRFPTSQLAPERDALDVRLAVASGDTASAGALARAFVERYPDSPLRGGIESIVRSGEIK